MIYINFSCKQLSSTSYTSSARRTIFEISKWTLGSSLLQNVSVLPRALETFVDLKVPKLPETAPGFLIIQLNNSSILSSPAGLRLRLENFTVLLGQVREITGEKSESRWNWRSSVSRIATGSLRKFRTGLAKFDGSLFPISVHDRFMEFSWKLQWAEITTLGEPVSFHDEIVSTILSSGDARV